MHTFEIKIGIKHEEGPHAHKHIHTRAHARKDARMHLEYVTVRQPFSGHFVTQVIGSSNTFPL